MEKREVIEETRMTIENAHIYVSFEKAFDLFGIYLFVNGEILMSKYGKEEHMKEDFEKIKKSLSRCNTGIF